SIAPLHAIALTHKARLDWLADGTLVLTLAGNGAATDQAAQAARCALAVRAKLSHRPIVLATGRGNVDGQVPAGEVIERAARLLKNEQPRLRAALSRTQAEPREQEIWIDELTAGLLLDRFEIDADDGRLSLLGERVATEHTRALCGKPTPC